MNQKTKPHVETSSLLDRRKSKRSMLLAFPVFLWMFFFLCFPLFLLVLYSFQKRGPYGGIVWTWTGDNYVRIFDPLYLKIFFNSLQLASLTTVACLLLSYPFALLCACVKKQMRYFLLAMIMIPFLTNFVIRAYAFKLLLGIEGPIVAFAVAMGLMVEPLPLSNQAFSVSVGMISNYLPFMVLPLFVAIDRFDFTLLQAAWDLGANKWRSYFKILIPLTYPGIKAGCLLTFIPALGEFVIPDLLGGARVMLIGNLVTEQFLKSRDWPFGAALSLVLIIAVMFAMLGRSSRAVFDSGIQKHYRRGNGPIPKQ